MKQYVIFLVIALIALTGAGQETDENYFNESNTTQPRFLGSQSFVNDELTMESVQVYLTKMLEYPQKSLECFQQGTEVVEFIVTADGKPTAFNIVNSVCQEMDEEVIRAIKTTNGKWVPGTVNGKPADLKQEISVIFTIYSYEEYMENAQKIVQKGNHYLFVHNKPKKALKYFNRAITLLPNEECLLVARSLCRYAKKDFYGAENDWKRMKVLARKNNKVPDMALYTKQISKLEGYEEMMKSIY